MALPIRTTVEDISLLCRYLSTKPTGASVAEARKVLDPKYLDGRKLAALKRWGLIVGDEARLKLTADGREAAKNGGAGLPAVLRRAIAGIEPYRAIIERASHRGELTMTATDVAAHWHEHFGEEAGASDKTLNDQAVCYFQIVDGAKLGHLVVGRSGAPTRIEFDLEEINDFISRGEAPVQRDSEEIEQIDDEDIGSLQDARPVDGQVLGTSQKTSSASKNNRVFITHGANRNILTQLKEIVQFGRFEPVVAVENETSSKPVPEKVMDDMRSCFAAIIHVAGEKVLVDEDGKPQRKINENVLIEIGAAMALYGRNFILLVENGTELPSNLQGLYQCRYEGNKLDMEATMKLLKAFNAFTQPGGAQ